MKILCLSDTVMPQMENAANLRRHYHDVELIVSCGDLPVTYLEFITSILSAPLFYVRGNHDQQYTDTPPGGEDLHGRIVTYRGLTFVGLEGSMRYNNSDLQFTEGQILRMALGFGPRLGFRRLRDGYGLDVLVTHSPPRGIHDLRDLPHTGFAALLRFMQWYRPRYMLHGHVHTYDRRSTTRTRYLDTQVINVNPVTVLDIEPRTQP